MSKLLLIALALTLLIPAATTADSENRVRDISCEICRKKDKDGNPCKGKVTRESTNSNGITYSCSNGHTFTVEPKVKVK